MDFLYFRKGQADPAKKFIQQHFKAGMTREEQLWTTMEWIHNNVEYAYVQNGAWAQITNKTYVDAVFTYRKGQCIQYNAAMAAMMAAGALPMNAWAAPE